MLKVNPLVPAKAGSPAVWPLPIPTYYVRDYTVRASLIKGEKLKILKVNYFPSLTRRGVPDGTVRDGVVINTYNLPSCLSVHRKWLVYRPFARILLYLFHYHFNSFHQLSVITF